MKRASKIFLVAGGLAILSASSASFAQHTTPFVTPPPPPPGPASAPAPAPAPSAVERAVVLMAMTGDGNVDPSLRSTAAALKQRLQERGFRDVDPGELNRAMAADPAGIATLRSRLGAACLVRVDVQAHDVSGVSLLISVQVDSGEQTAHVQSSLAEVAAKVLAAVDPLLPTARPVQHPTVPSPAPAVAPAPAVGLDRVVLVDGTIVEGVIMGFAGGTSLTLRVAEGKSQTIPWNQVKQIIPNATDDSSSWTWAHGAPGQEPVREADWSNRGGSLLTLDLQAQIIGILARSDHPYIINYPDGQVMTITGDSPAGGGGGGVGLHVGFMQLEIPDPSEGSTLWAFRAGTGIDLGYVAYAYRTDNITNVGQVEDGVITRPLIQEGGETKWGSASVVMLPLFVGGQIGTGQFVGSGTWRGLLFGLDWRPTYTYAKPSDQDGIGSFNYLGVQAHVDMASIQADEDGLEPNFRMTFTYLPKIDRNPMYATLGFGAVWY